MLTDELALQILTAALAAARTEAVRVTIAVVDLGGHLKSLVRMDGAPFHTVEFARDKAGTAAGFGIPTADWAHRLSAAPHVMTGLNGRSGFIPIGGGLPIIHQGGVIGGIGVSGGKENQDCLIAAAGLVQSALS